MNAVTEKVDHAQQNAQAWAQSIAAMVAAMQVDYDRLEELRDEHRALVETVDENGGDLEMARSASPDDAKVYALQGEYDNAVADLNKWKDENAEELRDLTAAATIDGERMENTDAVRERIQESPLSVEVRSGWASPGETMEAEEFCVLLSTGGPALRIRGELDGQYKQPRHARLEYQDWGTPWTEYHGEGCDQDDLLTFAQQFYFAP